MKRRKLTSAERREVYDKCGGHCAYCGCELAYKDMQIDHVVPLAFGKGEDELSNMLPACRSCNHRKGCWPLEIFRKDMERSRCANARQRYIQERGAFRACNEDK